MKIFLVLIGSALLLPSVSFADEWSKAIEDASMLEHQIKQNQEDMDMRVQDAEIDGSDELFPVVTGEEEDSRGSFAESTTHVTIRVNGVPIDLQDVPLYQWFAPYVRDVANKGLISGYRDTEGFPTGNFGPADNVTIEQLAKMAVHAAGVDTFQCGDQLRNGAAAGTWSETFIRCAEIHGWAIYADGTVDISRNATRAEVVVTVLQAFGVRIGPRSGTLFEDVNTSTEFAAAIEQAANDSIITGYTDGDGEPTGKFGPQNLVNRAETAKIFSLAFQVYDEE